VNNRRKLVIGLGASALSAPFGVFAQARAPFVVGWLNAGPRQTNVHYLVAFKEGMAALGWKEGVNYIIEERWADSSQEKLQPLALELAAKNPAIVLAGTVGATTVASKSMPHTPIVQGDGGSPITAGLAVSLARPGGLVTGVTNIAVDFGVKFLELLLEVIPSAKRIGFLADAGSPTTLTLVEASKKLLEQRRVRGFFVSVTKPMELETAMLQLAKEHIQGLVLLPASFFVAERERIVKIAMGNRWAISSGPHEFAEVGALLSYGSDRVTLYRRSAYFVDRILKGAKPADLPIEQPTKFDLVVNMKTANALGIKIPNSVLVQATKVIE
jgi:putative ABC transport system substrate-binding protein